MVDEAEVIGSRRRGIEKDMAAYERTVAELLRPIAPDLDGSAPIEVVTEINRRLQLERARSSKRDEQTAGVSQLRRRLARASEELEAARSELDALATNLGTEPTELGQVVVRSSHYQELVEQLSQCELDVLAQGSGGDLEEFERHCDGVDPDELSASIEAAARRVEELKVAHGSAVGAEAEATAALKAVDESDAAAEANERAQSHLAEAQRLAQEFIRLRLAHAILAREIEAWREANAGPVLVRASEMFKDLTLGRYERLKTDIDHKEKVVLVAVQPDGSEKHIHQLSAGTRDQLYFSLRLATLERQFERSAEPIPLILDDVLINFDDQRTIAALKVLGDVATNKQVLLFSHHASLIDAAKQALKASAYSVHLLPYDGKVVTLPEAGSAA